MIAAIYKIINLVTGDFYIGSSKDIENRYRSHFRDLKKDSHCNILLQRAYNKYGANNFIFHIIELCNPSQLLHIEQTYIDGLNPKYNISKCTTGFMRGLKMPERVIEKLRNRKPWNKGIPRTEEEKELMSSRKLEENKKKPIEWYIAMSNRTKRQMEIQGVPFKGKHHNQKNKDIFRQGWINRSRPIICINTGEVFNLQLDAAKKYNIRQGHINEVLKGKRKSAGGYVFKYYDNT